MEFAIEKCAMLIMKSGKRQMTKGIKLPNQGKIRTPGLKTYKYLGILEADIIKHAEMKERKNKKEYPRRTRKTRKLLEIKLHSRNLIKGINAWAIHFVRNSGPFLKWTREELRQMDKRTRKLITMHKALHPRNDWLHMPKKEGGKGLTTIQDCVDASV